MNLLFEILLHILIAITVHISIFFIVTTSKSKNIKGKHILITSQGDSNDFATHLGLECTRKGASITLVGKSTNLLKKAVRLLKLNKQSNDQKFQYKCLDISTNYDCVANCFKEAELSFGDIEMLINCSDSKFGISEVFDQVKVDDAKKVMDISYLGTYYTTRYVISKMKRKRSGTIVVASSQTTLMGIYGYGLQAVANIALRRLVETIAIETKPFGVSVTLAVPVYTSIPEFNNGGKITLDEQLLLLTQHFKNCDAMAKRLVKDALNGTFFSINGMESWILSILYCGIVPWFDLLFYLLKGLVLSPIEIIRNCLQLLLQKVIPHTFLEKESHSCDLESLVSKAVVQNFYSDEYDNAGNTSPVQSNNLNLKLFSPKSSVFTFGNHINNLDSPSKFSFTTSTNKFPLTEFSNSKSIYLFGIKNSTKTESQTKTMNLFAQEKFDSSDNSKTILSSTSNNHSSSSTSTKSNIIKDSSVAIFEENKPFLNNVDNQNLSINSIQNLKSTVAKNISVETNKNLPSERFVNNVNKNYNSYRRKKNKKNHTNNTNTTNVTTYTTFRK